jgi:DNA-binding NarL/FixJ family response regulator
MSFSVAIAESNNVTTWGVRSVVERLGGSVVVTAETGIDTLAMVETHKPTVLSLRLDFPRIHGFDILEYLKERTAAVEVVVLTAQDEESYVRTAFEQGATAYVLKEDPLMEVGEAFRAAAEGEYHLSDALPDAWMEAAGSEISQARTQCRSLTTRQRQVLKLTAEGHTSEEAGEKLDLSCRTVERHRRVVKEKLGLRNVTEMTRYAVHVGLYSTPGTDWIRQSGTG